jgi:hypothetical protein
MCGTIFIHRGAKGEQAREPGAEAVIRRRKVRREIRKNEAIQVPNEGLILRKTS